MEPLKIGTEVFVARWGYKEESEPCPECLGKRFLTVILGDDSRVTIDCAGCAAGYEPPRGVVKSTKRYPEVLTGTITGMEIKHGQLKYRTDSSYSVESVNIFLNREDAMRRAEEIAIEETKSAHEYLIVQKQNRNRTWAWNVHYYREKIRDAEKDIKLYTEKLAVALPKVREEKAAAK